MGQAKNRGTLEHRQKIAMARNEKFAAQIPKGSPMDKFQFKHGTQRLVTRLLMAGMIVVQRSPLETRPE